MLRVYQAGYFIKFGPRRYPGSRNQRRSPSGSGSETDGSAAPITWSASMRAGFCMPVHDA